ncbi:MAG TPA: malto-oligosyltrehalose synthase, partial [Polyangiaceae bacterium]
SWRVAVEEINYRRFFDVNDLAAIRMEDDAVFEQSHQLLFELLDAGQIQGLRLDHTDGLFDPNEYFERLQRKFAQKFPAPNDVGADDLARPLPLLVEKILEPGEHLRSQWLVDGTTGYDFGAALLGLFVEPKSETALTQLYRRFTGDTKSFEEHVRDGKRHILAYSLASEVNMLSRALERIAAKNRRWTDFTLLSLTRALTETIAGFPVYRTYVRPGEPLAEEDERTVEHALAIAQKQDISTSRAVFDFLREVLLLKTTGPEDERAEIVKFTMRFQQLTGAVMAKAVEDTAFYRYNRLLTLNEVGGMPSRFGTSVEELHEQNVERARAWPLAMTLTSTHDTKRGEDAALRIATLSEIPNEWGACVRRWSEMLDAARTTVDGQRAPSANHEYLFFQTLIGVWPFGWDGKEGRDPLAKRIGAFMEKATKEAKDRTLWTNPNVPYDRAIQDFVAKAMSHDLFLADVRSLCDKVAIPAAVDSLAATAIKLMGPGIPDTYQGAELWNQSLVDPDNRANVDFALRRHLLDEIRQKQGDLRSFARASLDELASGKTKLHLVHAALEARRANAELFRRGDYEPIAAGDNVFAFARSFGEERVITLVPRLVGKRIVTENRWPLGDFWQDKKLRAAHRGRYVNVLTGAALEIGGPVPLAEIFADYPIAILLRQRG